MADGTYILKCFEIGFCFIKIIKQKSLSHETTPGLLGCRNPSRQEQLRYTTLGCGPVLVGPLASNLPQDLEAGSLLCCLRKGALL